jgi:hypothetical protein
LDTEAEPALILEEPEREILADRARDFALLLNDPESRIRYQRLSNAADEGEIPDDLVGPLEVMLDLILQKAPTESEPVLMNVFRRTPRGQALASAARDINTALRSLRGQRLENVRFSSSPGRHALVLETDRVRLTLALDNAGPRIDTVESTA